MSRSNKLRDKRKFLEVRSRLFMALRTFFHERGFIEVETPVRIKYPALEDYIDAEPAGNSFLRTSPELHMKRLLAAGYEKIFQIGPCFRMGEFGERHRPEFTMLEWYEEGADYRDVLQTTVELLRYLADKLKVRQDYFSQQWQELTVHQAFDDKASQSLEACMAAGTFEEVLCFELEPDFGKEKPTVLIDYPAAMAALSRKKSGQPHLAERWELYIDGLEIANAYSELTDAKEQRIRFEETVKLRKSDGRDVYGIDPDFMSALEEGLPKCG
ncbi:MAG: EF-P lysine aminoacylase GenX, partial [Lentisphaeraceae bacterium]|nr:EF-P lysine aminoacylase GenX [Lentisphaeraceae bacterium]